jgi:hypothetical protein
MVRLPSRSGVGTVMTQMSNPVASAGSVLVRYLPVASAAASRCAGTSSTNDSPAASRLARSALASMPTTS